MTKYFLYECNYKRSYHSEHQIIVITLYLFYELDVKCGRYDRPLESYNNTKNWKFNNKNSRDLYICI